MPHAPGELDAAVEFVAGALARGQLVPLVGAGASCWAGLPAWGAVMAALARDLPDALQRAVPRAPVRFVPPADGALAIEDHLKIAEVHRRLCGPDRLHARLRELFDTTRIDAASLPLHGRLAALCRRAPAAYTTNFDDVLERALAASGLAVQVVAEAEDLQRWAFDRTPQGWRPRFPVYKLHGTLERPDTLVLGERDFHRRSGLAGNPIDLRFCSDVVGRSLLFVGYSFSDPNLRWIWTRLDDLAVRPRAFFLSLGPSTDLDLAYFEAVGILRVDLCASDPTRPRELTDFLDAVLARAEALVSPA